MGTTSGRPSTTLTGTLDFKPVPNSGALVLRPEFRYEHRERRTTSTDDDNRHQGFWTAVLGVVVTSM